MADLERENPFAHTLRMLSDIRAAMAYEGEPLSPEALAGALGLTGEQLDPDEFMSACLGVHSNPNVAGLPDEERVHVVYSVAYAIEGGYNVGDPDDDIE